MGASLVYLNEPNTEIEHETGSNEYLKFAAGSMQGWRLNMVRHPSTYSRVHHKQQKSANTYAPCFADSTFLLILLYS